MDETTVEQEYVQRFPILKDTATLLLGSLRELLKDEQHIDSISVRAKSVDRFIEKIHRKTYDHPLQDVQDQIGARVVVYYLSDVPKIKNSIENYYRFIEHKVLENDDPTSFSYRAEHYICLIPREIIDKANCPIEFFELQVSTLFQHAWSEASHDLIYKSSRLKTNDEKKRAAWAAAQAWGADRIFDELFADNNKELEDDIVEGGITST